MTVLRGKPIRTGILTVSDRVAVGLAEDVSGSTIVSWLEAAGYQVARTADIPALPSAHPERSRWSW